MPLHMSFKEFEELAQQHKPILVYREYPADAITPLIAYHKLSKPNVPCCLLDFSCYKKTSQRYSFLGFNPYFQFEAHGKTITQSQSTNDSTSIFEGDPFRHLQNCLASNLPVNDSIFTPFCGGLIGFLAYDSIRLLERIPDRHSDSEKIPTLRFQSYSEIIFFDHLREKFKIAVVVDSDSGQSLKNKFDRAQERIDEIILLLQIHSFPITYDLGDPSSATDVIKVSEDLEDNSYKALVSQAKEYFGKGEIFQVVISRTFKTSFSGDPLSIYRSLKSMNPSPYHFLLNYPDFSLVGASPEKLLSVSERDVEMVPIAGSCPRKGTDEDLILEEKLMADPKEDAEHMMLVDLARNDLGAVCVPGSVQVAKLKYLQRFSHISHLVSDVKGILQPSKSSIEALKMAFPAGTLTGAPKIRAIEIIDELENSRRGVYGGAICTLSSNGNIDSCLAIRTALLKDGMAFVRAGAGIVTDSDPQKEADETRHKARAVLKALQTNTRNPEKSLCI